MDIKIIRKNYQEAFSQLDWNEIDKTFKKMKWGYWWTSPYPEIPDLQKTVYELFEALIDNEIENITSFVNGYTYAASGRFEVHIRNDLSVKIFFCPHTGESRRE
jgi:hypothetical protein